MDALTEDFSFWSPYSYSFNDPIRFIDPDGNASTDIVLKGANNSSVTVETDLVDIELDAGSVIGDFGGNHTVSGDDVLEAALDIGGLVDQTGVIDAAAAVHFANKGEVGNAIISGLSILPAGDWLKLARVGKHTKTLKRVINCLTCFTGETLILTEDGAKQIHDIQLGDRVWAYNEDTGEIALKEVLQTHYLERDTIVEVHLSTGNIINATPNHPFFVHGSWFQVKDLSVVIY